RRLPSLDVQIELAQAPHKQARYVMEVVVWPELDVLGSRQQCLQGNARLRPSEGCAQAVMDPVAERKVYARLGEAIQIELVGCWVLAVVPIGRCPEQHDTAAARQRLPGHLGILLDKTKVALERRIESQCFLDEG